MGRWARLRKAGCSPGWNPLEGHRPAGLFERLADRQSGARSQYYTWRAKLTKRLIEEKGFSFVAVEGDWPDCYQVGREGRTRKEGERRCSRSLRACLESWIGLMLMLDVEEGKYK